MARPFTFHMQVREDIAAQNGAENLRAYFARPDVVDAFDKSEIIHFARTVLIPNARIEPGTTGTFAVQILIVYDGEVDELIDFFWKTPSLRSLFEEIATFAKIPCTAIADPVQFRKYIKQNNINRTRRELHKGYDLTVKQIREKFLNAAALRMAGAGPDEITEAQQ